MTFLTEVQTLLERIYSPVGVDLGDCLISHRRSQELSRASFTSQEESFRQACTFLREQEGSLTVGIYYAPELIETLETLCPHDVINHINIHPLLSFIEEIDHALHAAHAYRRGWRCMRSEQFACHLELQAHVDCYWVVLHLFTHLTGEQPSAEIKNWLKERIFNDASFDYSIPSLTHRYRLANRMGIAFIQILESLPKSDRLPCLRSFASASLTEKYRMIRQFAGG